MSAFAYKDAQRQYRVEATDAQPGQCEYYFCLQEGCGARMHLVRAENPYFSANKGYGHAWNCIYASGNFDHSKYDRENLTIELFIERLKTRCLIIVNRALSWQGFGRKTNNLAPISAR